MQDNELTKFVRGIVKEKNLIGVEQDVLEQLVKDLATLLERQINSALLQQVSDKDLDEYEALINSNDIDGAKNFFYNKGIDVSKITIGVMGRFRTAYLSS